MSCEHFSDAHLHMTEDGWADGYSDAGDACILASCTSRRAEWETLSGIEDGRVVRFYGIHPWFADEWCGQARDELMEMLEQGCAHVGEIGLDSKSGPFEPQIPAFREQLEAASETGKAVAVHMIGTEKQVFDILRGCPDGIRGTILHSYGSDSYVKPFGEIGCYFSLSPRILSRSPVRVSRLLDAIPPERLLLETDAPHSGKGFCGMRDFARRLGEASGRDGDDLLSMAADNLGRLLG